MDKYIFLEPIFKEMVWGSESWAISAHKNGDCKIINGDFKDKTLSEVWKNNRELFGNIEGDEFPLLAKFIDAKDKLSVQVHPNDAYAKFHEDSLGKNECWYLVDCEHNATITVGHNALFKKQLISYIEKNEYDQLLTPIAVKKDDFFYIEAGTIHSIGAGCYIYEIQQSSDITYRLYDYDRKDKNGKLRELNLARSLNVITIPSKPYENVIDVIESNDNKITQFIQNNFFTITKYEINGKYEIKNDKPFLLVTVVNGFGTVDSNNVVTGTSFIVTAEVKSFVLKGELTVIVSSV